MEPDTYIFMIYETFQRSLRIHKINPRSKQFKQCNTNAAGPQINDSFRGKPLEWYRHTDMAALIRQLSGSANQSRDIRQHYTYKTNTEVNFLRCDSSNASVCL